jgi:hypothetical protein
VFPAIFLQLAVAWPASRRALLLYAGASAVLLLPAIAVYLGVWEQATRELALARFTEISLEDRALAWATETALIVSAGGLVGSLVGVSILARRGVVFPLVFVLTHFALCVSSQTIGITVWPRTVVYLVPILLLGLAYLSVRAVQGVLSARGAGRRLLWLAALLICTGSYSFRQAVALASPRDGCSWIPEYCLEYAEGNLREVVAGIDRELPPGARLAPGSYPIQDVFRLLSDRSDVTILPPLNQLIDHYDAGDLNAYTAQRGVGEMRADTVWTLVGQDRTAPQASRIGVLFGPTGLAWFDPPREPETVRSWETGARAYGVVTLSVLRPAAKP